jgi:S1-C subfamily serine protease
MRFFYGVLLVLLPLTVQAQAYQEYSYTVQSGTGFFVNRQYVITNAHVVKGCSDVVIKGAIPEHDAKVIVFDTEHDLALLETDMPPPQFAPLRFNIDDLKAGDQVYVIGFPGAAGARGEYVFSDAHIEDIKIENDDKKWFYINDVIEHGNSGGPVFDTSGNVIGVVVAKSVISTVYSDTKETISEKPVGVVITLGTLKQFLLDHGVFTEWGGSGTLFGEGYIEEHARDYIVNVQCRIKD